MSKDFAAFSKSSQRLSQKHPGKYVAIVDGKPVFIGKNRLEAYSEARKRFPRKRVGIFYLPTEEEVLTALWSFRMCR